MPALDPRHRADPGPVGVDNLHPFADRREQLTVQLLLVSGHCSSSGSSSLDPRVFSLGHF